MANTMTNREMAQTISARIGNSPVPFDSVYSISLQIYNELGGEPAQFDSVYSILLEILPLISGGGISGKVIDDNSIVLDKTWSSSKINSEIESLAGSANSEIVTKETVDFKFVNELPVSGEDDELVVIKGDNQDTLYKYVSGEWVEQTPDANILYFDVENEALYSYVTVDRQFAPVSLVNTIVVGSNLNTNAALKAIKTPGVYNVIQRLTNKTKGDYLKNWTLTVESIDYEEYDKSDSIYQKLTNNYTIQKRTWSSTRVANDGWVNFSTYYTGEIKDSTTSKYYTWSSNKIAAQIADAGFDVQIVQSLPQSGEAHTIYFVPASESEQSNYYDEFMWVDNAWEKVGSTEVDLSGYYTKVETDALLDAKQESLTAGQNIDITNDTISAKGYKYDDNSGYFEKTGGLHVDGLSLTDSTNFSTDGIVGGDYATCFGKGTLSVLNARWLGRSWEPYTFSWETDSTTITCNQDLDVYVSDSFQYQIFLGMVLSYNGVDAVVTDISGHNITLSNTFGEGQTNVPIKYYSTASTGRASICFGENGRSTARSAVSAGQISISDGQSSFSQGFYSRAAGWGAASFGIMSFAENEGSAVFNTCNHTKNKYEFGCGTKNKSHIAYDYETAYDIINNWGSAITGGNTLFSVGCGVPSWGTSKGWRNEIIEESTAKKNAIEVMQNADMYVKGIGGYDGVHIKSETGYESTKTLQDVISGIDTSISGKQDTLTAGSNITISGNTISATDTTYSDATQSASGLMSAADKTKLNGIEANAEVNVIEGVILSDSVSALTPDANKNVTIPLVSTSNDGLMSAEDKAKLDGLEEYTVATTQEIQALFVMPAFYVDNTQFITNGKMTWGQWLSSKYNTSSFTHIYTASSYDSSTEQIPEVSSSSYPVAGGNYYSTCTDTYVPQTGPANDEIWYTTESGNLWEPTYDFGNGLVNTLEVVNNNYNGNEQKMLSNTYVNGHGVIKYSEPIFALNNNFGISVNDTDLTTLTLPHGDLDNNGFAVYEILGNTTPQLEAIYYNGTVAECEELSWSEYQPSSANDINEIICLDGTYSLSDEGGGDYGGGGGY